MLYEDKIKGKKKNTLIKIHKQFLYNHVIPYLTDVLGFERIKKYPYKKSPIGTRMFYMYKKDDIVILIAKKRYNRITYFIVTEVKDYKYKLLGTIAYSMVFQEYHLWLFAGDLFEILNKDYYGTIEFIGLQDYYSAKGREYPFYRALSLQRGDNPFSRRALAIQRERQDSV